MAEKPATERTEQPTARKLSKARDKGQVPQSQELPSVATIAALVLILALSAPYLMSWFNAQLKQGLSCQTSMFADGKSFSDFINGKIIDLMAVTLPLLAAILVGSTLASVAVSGLNFAPDALSLKWNAINPAAGLQQLMNSRSLVHLGVSVAKLLFVSVVAWLYIHSRLDTFAALRWAWSSEILTAIAQIILGLMIRLCIALLVIAAADVFYQRWKYIQDLKMTRQEIKEEHREVEGSPEVKSRIRKIQIEMTRKRMLQEVPKANVVLVNPTHVAVALRYDAKTTESPVVVAKGADNLAEK